ncbi:MAG: glutamine amidotransferase family protein [Syntrophomonadaceae bacterium]|nr:glutamine amidotransferase family protein [Syntrophomonadaceae bacterium]
MNLNGQAFGAGSVVAAIAMMHDRSNGLGGGFAAYGIYPQMADCYAFHLFYQSGEAKEQVERYLRAHYQVRDDGPLPTRPVRAISDSPVIWRYFLVPEPSRLEGSGLGEEEYVVKSVMSINREMPGAFVASGGKNMGAFKAVGYPEDVAEFYRLEDYQAHLWTAHGRFPTNTPGWWGGAHPFTLLDWSVVHNGEISSYGTNRRYLEMHGYYCGLQTDTEAITYLFDLLVRRHGLPLEVALRVMAAPFWEEIARMEPEEQALWKTLRSVYGPAMLNGPFSIIVGCRQGMIALNDRIKLRPLVAASHGDFVYVASEESAIRAVCPAPQRVWTPRGGEPVFGLLRDNGDATRGCPPVARAG